MGPSPSSNTYSTQSSLNAHQISPQHPNPKPFYKGQCDDQGRHHGQGVMKYSDQSIFQGQFRKGSPYHGVFKYLNGNKYKGYLQDNKPHGQGQWIEQKGTFTGEFQNGQFIEGVVKYSDGAYFKGKMRNSLKHGTDCFYRFSPRNGGDTFEGEFQNDQFKQGVYKSKDLTYDGMFKNSLKHGQGHLIVNKVADYKGNFEDDQFHGEGTLTNLKNKQMYEGQFYKGKKHGYGKVFNANKQQIYDGQFVNGEKHGKGIYEFDTKKYEGEFYEGKFHGEGILKYGQSDVYTGSFKQNKKHGKGYLCLTNNTIRTYKGQFENDLFNGHGEIEYSNGDQFVGLFVNNKRHGEGVYETEDKSIRYEGFWIDDSKQGEFKQIIKDSKQHKETIGPYRDNEKNGIFRVIQYKPYHEQRKEHWILGKRQYINTEQSEGSGNGNGNSHSRVMYDRDEDPGRV